VTHLKPALALHGITYENISAKGGLLYWGKFTDALEMLAAGQLDAVFAYGGQPISAIQTLSMTRKIRIIPWTKEELDAAFQSPTPGYGPRTLLAGTYKRQDKDIQVIGYWNAISVSSDLPDDAVYNICWAIYGEGRHNRFYEMSATGFLKDSLGFALIQVPIPFHPGADKFWKDFGMKVPKPMTETNPPIHKK
jgi:TRAP transporter TAXI family solute receptor